MSALLILKQYWRVMLYAVCILAGWQINQWRWEAKYAQQLEAARDNEQALQASVDAIANKSATEMRRVNDKYLADLDRLRKRPERMPESARANCAGTSGRELSRPDAEAFVRLAADAEQHRQGLIACYAAYDKIKEAINGE